MLKEKIYLLVSQEEKHKNFVLSLKENYVNIEVFNNQHHLIQEIEASKEENCLLVLFAEYPYLDNISLYMEDNFNPSKYILVSFYNVFSANISIYKNLFDFILTNAEYDINFFLTKIDSEIINKNRISLLQSEVKEFYEIGKSLTSEKNTLKLFEMIINSSISMTSSDAGTMYLIIDKNNGKWKSIKNSSYDKELLKFVVAKNTSVDIEFEQSTSPITANSISGYTIISGKSIRIDDAYNIDMNLEFNHDHSYDRLIGYRTKSILSIPMKDNKNNIMGVIQLINKKKNKQEKINYSNPSSIGNIIPFDYTDELIMNSLAGQAAVALENNLLYEEMQDLVHSYKEQNNHLIFLSRKILKAHEEERRRIAREIHDGPAQLSANLSLKLEICKRFLQNNEYEKSYKEIEDLKKDVQATIKEIRTIIYDLKPSYFEGGLISALENRLNIFKETKDIDVTFKVTGDDEKVEYYLASTIYRIIQEALSNVFKHADANNVYVQLDINEHTVSLKISDDGKGFNTSNLFVRKQRSIDSGFGLEGIKERIELVKGKLEITSAPSQGTKILINIPLF